MKHLMVIFNLLLLGLVSCNNQTQGQQVENTKPMYGEVPKTEEIRKIDEDFRKESLAQFKTIEKSVDNYLTNAWSYFYNNELETAMKRFNQAWLLNPEFPDSYFGFASLLELQNDSTEAKRFYQIGLEKDKKNQRAIICYQRIADCKEQLNDIKGAINAYIKITELNQDSSFAFKKIGFLQMNSNNPYAAKKAYDIAIELDPNDAMTYNNRAYLHQNLKEYSKAISDYSKAIEINPTYISALVNRGLTQMETKNFKLAKNDFETCVKLDSEAAELRRFLGLSKLKLLEKENACKDFIIAKQLGDKNIDDLIKQCCN